MNYVKLRELNSEIYFRVDSVSRKLNISIPSTRVLCSRYVKRGLFMRLKRDFYILREKWENLTRDEFYILANFLQVPSYISFLAALNFYELTTQVQRDFYESAALKRTRTFEVDGVVFSFYKLKNAFYSDFNRSNGFFMASPEKALLDCLYLYTFGKYKLDLSSLDLKKFNLKRLKKISMPYPERTKKLVRKLCGIS